MYYWGNPDENTCHVSSGNVFHVASGGGVPTTPILKNHASLVSRVKDANMACLCMLLLLLGLLFVGRLSVVTLSRCGHISHTIGIKDS